jgi:hypothetical protein
MVAMNITQIEQNIKKLLEISDQGFSASKIHIFCGKNACDLDNMQIRYLSADSHYRARFSNTNKVQDNSIEMNILDVPTKREKDSEKILAELYDFNQMPDSLRQAHHNLDIVIEQCYHLKPFASDEERLEHLFTLYEQMTSKGTK